MSKPYRDLVTTRNEYVDGLTDWTWIKTDNGAWDGPKSDWETSHKTKYFENVKKFDCVVQAGGNQGMYPRLLSRLFKLVYTFEPDPLNFFCLVDNCQEDNIIKIQGALGSAHGLCAVRRQTMSNVGMHTVAPGGSIPMFPLDSFKLPAVDCILLDIESYELEALRGMPETIEKHRPVIVCENPHSGIYEFLRRFNYSEGTNMSKSDGIFVPLADK